ncbi:hypothetical protein FGX00_03355, partial [Xylella fastidiosa subsp. multiplex]|nr:hypothetical protein [Xylella fastidiosa subsp. multiplex]
MGDPPVLVGDEPDVGEPQWLVAGDAGAGAGELGDQYVLADMRAHVGEDVEAGDTGQLGRVLRDRVL